LFTSNAFYRDVPGFRLVSEDMFAAVFDLNGTMLADEPNIREVILFPMNQQAQDLLMQAPAETTPERLKELHIKLDLPKPKKD